MSVDVLSVSDLSSDDDDDTSKDLMTFCMQLSRHSQSKSSRILNCGSTIEIPYHLVLIKHFRMSTSELDTDCMVYYNFRLAVHRAASLPETYTGEIIRIYTDEVHTGYVKLIKEKDNKELLLSDLKGPIPDCNIARHGPALLSNIDYLFVKMKFSLNHYEDDTIECKKFLTPFRDMVSAVHSPYWPVEAHEWIIRKRPHDFPSKSLINQVIRYGCDFVQVSHKLSNHDSEWRFSFSKAEQFIIESWSISQRAVYMTLWLLNKRIASSNLCSYYWKTLMLWACEEKPSKFWHEDILVYSVAELLLEMMKWVNSKFCANYFIPGNNMMDHLISIRLSYEIDALWTTLQSRELITEVTHTCRGYELMYANTERYIESPAWIKRAIVIREWVENYSDSNNYTDMISTNLTPDLQNALYVELSDIYRGLCFQQKSLRSLIVSDRHIYLFKAERHLLIAVSLCESLERDVIDNCSWSFSLKMKNYFMSGFSEVVFNKSGNNNSVSRETSISPVDRPTQSSLKSLNVHKDQTYCLYSRCVEKHEYRCDYNFGSEKICKSRSVKIAIYEVGLTKMNECIDKSIIFYKEWPGKSPTVNVSWFIAKAYLANLYYATQRDVSQSVTTCDDIINTYRLSYMNSLMAEETFPVVLSTQWTCIYDKEIQGLLGFYSLCSYMFDASSRSVYLGVCPVLFALYIKERIEIQHLSSHWAVADNVGFNEHVTNRFLGDYKELIPKCCCDRKVNNGSSGLLSILRLSRLELVKQILNQAQGKGWYAVSLKLCSLIHYKTSQFANHIN